VRRGFAAPEGIPAERRGVFDDDARRFAFDAANSPGGVASSMTSPAMLSTAKSSSTVPTTPPSGSATTVNRALSESRRRS